MHEKLRHRALGWWARLVCRRAGWVLFVTGAIALAAGGVTVGRLEFQSDRNELLSEELEWNRRFIEWRVSFPGNEDLFVVVDAGEPTQPGHEDRLARAQAVVDELGPALQADEHIELAVWGFNLDQFSPRAIRLLPLAEFEARLAQIAQSTPVLVSPSPQAMFAAVMQQMQRSNDQADEKDVVGSIQRLTDLINATRRVLARPRDQRPDFGAMAEAGGHEGATLRRQYLVSSSGRLLFIRVTPRQQINKINGLRAAIGSIRARIDQVLARHEGVEAGLTGIEVVEADETDAATRDSTIASIIASVLICVMLIAAFHSWRVPLLIMVALLVGIVWTFGFLTLAVGHLQVLSVVFAVILLGLGVAFGIHLASRVELDRHRYGDDTRGLIAAMADSFETVGPGVITGAVTTAAAFCMTMLTDFKGVAEMGLIAGAGVMLCLFAMFSVFPALLAFFAHSGRHHVPMDLRRVRLFDPVDWVMPLMRRPRTTIVFAGVLTAVSLLAVTRMKFDYDLLRLQPRGVDSVLWQDRITRLGGQSIWSAVSVADSLDAARQRKIAFQKLGTVGKVNGIGLLFPEDEGQKLAQLDQVARSLEPAVTAALAEPIESVDGPSGAAANGRGVQRDLIGVLSAMRLGIGAASGQDMPVAIRQGLDNLGKAIDRTVAIYAGLDVGQRQDRQSHLRTEYRQWRRALASRLAVVLDRSPLTPDDLPAELLRPYIATSGPHKGSFALEVHPRLPQDQSIDGPLDPKFLPGFIEQMEDVDPTVTGVIAQIYRSGHLILRSYQMAGVYALVVVFLLVWLDFRSLRAAVLCLVPVAVGFAVTFGVMWLASVSVNPANIIVLPLMFGIGVDSGVHMLHRFRQDPATRPLGLSGGTGKGITVTSLATMIGFGSMMFARHRGIASLGFVMMTGIGMTMLACWTVVPAWLQLRAGRNLDSDQLAESI